MRLSTSALLLIILFLGCSEGGSHKTTNQAKETTDTKERNESTSGTNSSYEVKFERDVAFSSTDNVIVGEITSFAIDDQNQVFIADQSQTTIQVFNPDGSYLTSLGKQGKGPAEFAAVSPNTRIEIHSNLLYVPDYTNSYNFFPARVQVFSLKDLSFSHTIKLIADNRNDYKELDKYFPKRIYPRNDGTLLVAYHRLPNEYRNTKSFIKYVIQDSTGNIVSGPILEQKDRTNLVYFNKKTEYPYLAIHSFPFFGKSLLAVSADGYLYTARTEEFKIDVYSPNGKYIRTFGNAFENRPLNRSQLMDRYRRLNYMARLGDGVALKMIREANNLPETWPALESMFFDDENRLWVSTVIDNNEVYEWWVLKNTGELITKFKWPRDKPIEAVNNGYLYTREADRKTGLQQILRYRIEMNLK